MSTRALQYLYCRSCGHDTLHNFNTCIHHERGEAAPNPPTVYTIVSFNNVNSETLERRRQRAKERMRAVGKGNGAAAAVGR